MFAGVQLAPAGVVCDPSEQALLTGIVVRQPPCSAAPTLLAVLLSVLR